MHCLEGVLLLYHRYVICMYATGKQCLTCTGSPRLLYAYLFDDLFYSQLCLQGNVMCI